MLKKFTTHILVIVSTAFALIVNFVSLIAPINGTTVQEVSDQYQVYFVPANYVFSIWSLIYLGLILFAVYQVLPKGRADERLNKIRKAAIVSNVLNGLWIIVWTLQLLPLATLVMISLLATLLYIYWRLPGWYENVGRIFRLTTLFTFSVYFGWISVASIANIAMQLYSLNWTALGIGGEYWAGLMCLVAADIAINLIWIRRDYPFAFVVIWATVGIFVRFANVPALAVTALISAGIVALAILLSWYKILIRKLRRNSPKNERSTHESKMETDTKTAAMAESIDELENKEVFVPEAMEVTDTAKSTDVTNTEIITQPETEIVTLEENPEPEA